MSSNILVIGVFLNNVVVWVVIHRTGSLEKGDLITQIKSKDAFSSKYEGTYGGNCIEYSKGAVTGKFRSTFIAQSPCASCKWI